MAGQVMTAARILMIVLMLPATKDQLVMIVWHPFIVNAHLDAQVCTLILVVYLN